MGLSSLSGTAVGGVILAFLAWLVVLWWSPAIAELRRKVGVWLVKQQSGLGDLVARSVACRTLGRV